MKQSLVLALVGCLSAGCAFDPNSKTGSEEAEVPTGHSGTVQTPADPTDPEPADPGADLTAPNPSHHAPFFADTGEAPASLDAPEPGSDLPLDGDFVSLAVGELASVSVDSVYDQPEGSDLCGDDGYFRVARSDGMGNTLVVQGWSNDDTVDFSVHLDQLKRVNDHWERLVAYVGPDFLDTEYESDLRIQEDNSGDVVINITRARGVGPSGAGILTGNLFVRLRGTCME